MHFYHSFKSMTLVMTVLRGLRNLSVLIVELIIEMTGLYKLEIMASQ